MDGHRDILNLSMKIHETTQDEFEKRPDLDFIEMKCSYNKKTKLIDFCVKNEDLDFSYKPISKVDPEFIIKKVYWLHNFMQRFMENTVKDN